MVRVKVVAGQDHLCGLRAAHVHPIAQDRGENQHGAPGPRHARFRYQLLADLVHADDRFPFVRSAPVDFQHILHIVHEGGICLRGIHQHFFSHGFNAFF